MIKFDPNKLTVRHVRMKSVTTALGGSMTVLDEKRSTNTKEVFTKVKVPLAVARQFMKSYSVRQYMKPTLVAIAEYAGRPVALERHPMGSLAEGDWTSNSETNVNNFFRRTTAVGNWYTDGSYVYNMDEYEQKGTSLQKSLDGHFQEIPVTAMKFAAMSLREAKTMTMEKRVCLMFVAANGKRAISPPIWKTLETIGNAQFNKSNNAYTAAADIEDVGENYQGLSGPDHFDRIDEHLCVNLAFVIKAGRELTNVFGYDAIEPLNLPGLMLEMKTVNLPNVANSVKQTYNSGVPFTHMAAWLIGLLTKVDTLDAYLVIRSLLKHLSTKGVYRKDAFSLEKMFRPGHSHTDIQVKTVDEAAKREGVESETRDEYIPLDEDTVDFD